MKIVLNRCFGGYWLSDKAQELLKEKHKDSVVTFCSYYHDRSNPKLVDVVDELGEEASSSSSRLRVVEIPDYIEYWEVKDNDGMEWIKTREGSFYR